MKHETRHLEQTMWNAREHGKLSLSRPRDNSMPKYVVTCYSGVHCQASASPVATAYTQHTKRKEKKRKEKKRKEKKRAAHRQDNDK